MASTETSEAWDFIIIGGGSAGCVLANRLSADPQTNVLLLEAGGSDRSLSVAVPALVMQAIASKNWPGDEPVAPGLAILDRSEDEPWVEVDHELGPAIDILHLVGNVAEFARIAPSDVSGTGAQRSDPQKFKALGWSAWKGYGVPNVRASVDDILYEEAAGAPDIGFRCIELRDNP